MEESAHKIVVMNTKGGCGKTTIATNLASYYSKRGFATVLYDYDPQSSSMRWLDERPENCLKPSGVRAYETTSSSMTRAFQLRVPVGTDRIVVDTPAALSKDQLFHFSRYADVILIPVLPSSIDSHVAADFIHQLMIYAKVRTHGTRLAIVANRVRESTRSFKSLERFLSSLDIPVVAHLHDSQNYVQAADRGIGIHEFKAGNNYREKQNWKSIIDWIEAALSDKLSNPPNDNIMNHQKRSGNLEPFL